MHHTLFTLLHLYHLQKSLYQSHRQPQYMVSHNLSQPFFWLFFNSKEEVTRNIQFVFKNRRKTNRQGKQKKKKRKIESHIERIYFSPIKHFVQFLSSECLQILHRTLLVFVFMFGLPQRCGYSQTIPAQISLDCLRKITSFYQCKESAIILSSKKSLRVAGGIAQCFIYVTCCRCSYFYDQEQQVNIGHYGVNIRVVTQWVVVGLCLSGIC